jgi:NAD(P)-dependent dehydrogenase (short-subunit alcohol dehydrogenase family)
MAEVAVVTGAAGALGAEVARVLRARGKRLVLVDSANHEDRLRQLARELGEAVVVAGDVASQSTWDEALPRVERDLGSAPELAALIAGTWRGGKALHEETDDATWQTLLHANLETVYRSLRALLPGMVAKGRGSVVVVGSRAAQAPSTSARAAAYAATKAAVVALAQATAAEVLGHGVRVNAILPSTLDTPANRAAMPKADPGRWVSLPSAAGVIAFLLGDEARDVSGTAVPVYGRA